MSLCQELWHCTQAGICVAREDILDGDQYGQSVSGLIWDLVLNSIVHAV